MFREIIKFILHPILYICELRFIRYNYRKVKITVYNVAENEPIKKIGSVKISGVSFEAIWDKFKKSHLSMSGNHLKWKQIIF